jgi:hypothetical protein
MVMPWLFFLRDGVINVSSEEIAVALLELGFDILRNVLFRITCL